MKHRRPCALLLCALAAACTPALDWREVRDGSPAVVALFPCRPDRVERSVALGGERPRMRLLSCSAAGMTFALGHVQVADAAALAPALAALRTALVGNVAAAGAGAAPASRPWHPPGAASSVAGGRALVDGRLPDGAPVRVAAGWFAHGRGAWQASVVGAVQDPAAVETFFDGVRAGR